MPTKTPIYFKSNGKKNVASQGKGGKKLRELLSSEMISLPLGDFRHTAHVGKGADDVFGDTTFLKLNSSVDNKKRSNVREESLLLGSLRRNGFGKRNDRMPKQSKNGTEKSSRPLSEQSYDGYGIEESPILKSAISLPMLNQPMMSTAVPLNDSKQTKSKKTKKGFSLKLAQNKTKSHETGLNCLSTAPQELAYQRSSAEILNPPKEAPTSEGESSSHQSSTVKLTNKAAASSTSSSSALYSDEAWTFDLDLGSSLLDEVLNALNRSEIRA